MKVVQARLPQSLRHAYETRRVEASLSLPPGLRLLVKRYIAHLNGCAFCVDLAEARAEAQGMDVALLRRAAEHRQSDRVAERDRAALRFAREATETVHVGDETFAAVRDHFSEREIVELTWLCATENYWNRITGPLGIGSDGLCPV
jgi:AhpD family alkylhydroperoxidase